MGQPFDVIFCGFVFLIYLNLILAELKISYHCPIQLALNSDCESSHRIRYNDIWRNFFYSVELSDPIIRGTVPFQKLIKQLLCSDWQSIECFIYQLSQWPLIRCLFTKGQQQVIIYLIPFPGKWTTQKSIRRVHFYRVVLMYGLLAGFSWLRV